MIVITRNGKTKVYTGWREWLLLGAGLAICWLALALIAVFFWTAHRPDLLPPWAVFLLGIFSDLASGGLVVGATCTIAALHKFFVGPPDWATRGVSRTRISSPRATPRWPSSDGVWLPPVTSTPTATTT